MIQPDPDLKNRLDAALIALRDPLAEYAATVMAEGVVPEMRISESAGAMLRLTFGLSGLIRLEMQNRAPREGVQKGIIGAIINATEGMGRIDRETFIVGILDGTMTVLEQQARGR